MISELSAAMAAIREIAQLAKLINDAKTEAEVNAAVSELNSKLASIQRECISLVELVGSYQEINASLKAKIAEFENFEHKAEGYVLEQLESGSLVYSKKQTVNGKETTVHLCPNCFTRQVISVLQPSEMYFFNAEKEQYFTQCHCHSCSSVFAMHRSSYDPMKGFPVAI